MELLIGIITIFLIAKTLKVLGVEEVGCMTLIVILIGLPFIKNIGAHVIDLFFN